MVFSNVINKLWVILLVIKLYARNSVFKHKKKVKTNRLFLKFLCQICPTKDFKDIKVNPFNVLNEQDEDIRDPDLDYFSNLHSKSFDRQHVLVDNTKRYLCDTKKYENVSMVPVNISSINSEACSEPCQISKSVFQKQVTANSPKLFLQNAPSCKTLTRFMIYG